MWVTKRLLSNEFEVYKIFQGLSGIINLIVLIWFSDIFIFQYMNDNFQFFVLFYVNLPF